jgi:hypothetical protein
MMLTNPILDHLVMLERYQELLDELGPAATAVAALIAEDDISITGAAEILGCSSRAAGMRLTLARGRVLETRPELAAIYRHRGAPARRCVDCGARIDRRSTRCYACFRKWYYAPREEGSA